MIRRHSISWFLATACILALAASCVYPFAPEAGSEDGSGALVIEGDILLGDYTTVTLSYSSAVSTPKVSDDPPRGAVWVEDDAGRTYRGVPVSGAPGTYRVDTREAAAGPQYRLCVQNMDTNKEYMSAWADACRAPVIDSLSYIMDYDRERMNIAISMHSQAGSFFKWRYVEDWEYHSVYEARLLYTPPSLDRWGHPVTAGNLGEMPSGLNTHVCWGHKASSEILIFTTEKQTDDRFVDLEFHSIARNDDRISVIYHIDVVLEPISRDAYL